MDNISQLENEKIGSLLLKFSIPAITGMLVNALYNVVDRIFIGQGLGPMAISGLAITFPYMQIILGFSMLVGMGGTARVSIRLGEGERERAEKLLGNMTTLLVAVSALITVVGLIFLDKSLIILGASEATLPYAREYMRVILAGCVFQIVSFGLNHTMRATGHPQKAMFTMLIGAVINIILDPIFIYSFGLGIAGAAYATIISQFISLVWIFYFYLGESATVRIRLKNLKVRLKTAWEIVSLGVSGFSMQIASSFVTALINLQLKRHGGEINGDLAIGAYSIIISISMLILMPIFGLNQGMQPIIGYNYGARKIDRVKKTFKITALAATIICTVGWAIAELFPKTLILPFARDDSILEIGSLALRYYMLTFPLVGFQINGSFYFQCVGKSGVAFFLSLIRQVIILIPLVLILPAFYGMYGVWYAEPVADVLALLITALLLTKEWKLLEEF